MRRQVGGDDDYQRSFARPLSSPRSRGGVAWAGSPLGVLGCHKGAGPCRGCSRLVGQACYLRLLGEEAVVSVLEVPSLVDAVQQAMRVRILDGKVPPGVAVTEVSVANEFSVARTTAKAAVERLVHDGLLRRTANKSARVPVLGFEEVRDVYFSRGLIEATVMQRLAVAGTVPAEAKEALRRFDEGVESGIQAQVVESDVAFHRALVDSLGSERF